jgi:hypothetical protein
MRPFPGPHEGTSHNPVPSDALLHPGHRSLRSLCLFDRLVPHQRQARPTHYNSKLSLGSVGGKSFAQSIFRDGSVRGTITKGLFVLGAQHPRIFGRGHISLGGTNIAPFFEGAVGSGGIVNDIV